MLICDVFLRRPLEIWLPLLRGYIRFMGRSFGRTTIQNRHPNLQKNYTYTILQQFYKLTNYQTASKWHFGHHIAKCFVYLYSPIGCRYSLYSTSANWLTSSQKKKNPTWTFLLKVPKSEFWLAFIFEVIFQKIVSTDDATQSPVAHQVEKCSPV